MLGFLSFPGPNLQGPLASENVTFRVKALESS